MPGASAQVLKFRWQRPLVKVHSDWESPTLPSSATSFTVASTVAATSFTATRWGGRKMPAAASFDVIIIGGGPAGISCGLELHESKLNVVVLERKDQLGGQLADIRNTLRNFAGGFYESG